MAAGSDRVPPTRNPFGFGDESAPPTNERSEPVADWHAGRISTAQLAELLTAEVLGDIEVFTRAQRTNSVKYGPAWSVAFWWHEVRDELDLTGSAPRIMGCCSSAWRRRCPTGRCGGRHRQQRRPVPTLAASVRRGSTSTSTGRSARSA